MARKTITDASSFEDRAQAAAELVAAQRQLNTWLNSQTNPTYSQIANQSRYIASQYDYVDWGNPPPAISGSGPIELTVGGEQFFVNGIGTNPNSVSVPTDIIPNTDDAFSPAPVITDPTQTLPSNPQQPNQIVNPFDPANRQTTDTFNSGSLLEDPNVTSSVNGAGGVDSSGREIPQPDPLVAQSQSGIIQQSGVTASNNQSVNNSLNNSDDQGGNSGTGLNSGFSDSTDLTNDSIGNEFSDSEREDEISNNDLLSSNNGNVSTGLVSKDQTGKTNTNTVGSGIESNNPAMQVRQNVLHNYANWTYNISWYMLKKDVLVNLTNITQNSRNAVLLMKSGGTGRVNTNSQGAFSKDYYIENLSFQSYFSIDSNSGSGNNFDIEFEVVEPYGVAFIAELVLQAQQLGIEDHLDTPYLLEITFKGYDDNGKPVNGLENFRKIIPIKLTEIKFSINSSGTRYNIKAIPYHHDGLFDSQLSKIIGSVKLKGKTFEELIGELQVKINQDLISDAEKQGYPSGVVDTVQFNILEDDLKQSKVGYKDGKVEHVRKDFQDTQSETIQIESNSILKDAVQNIMNATDFGAKKNTRDMEGSEGNNQPIRLIKLIPRIVLGDYIPQKQRYARNITFDILTEKKHGYDIPNVANAPVPRRGWVKEYNWIFTGQNQDIINFDAVYNYQYIFSKTAFQEVKARALRVGGSQDAQDTPTPRPPRINSRINNVIVNTKSQPDHDKVGQSYRSKPHLLSSDIMDHFLNNPKSGDMLKIDLDIIGDPDWIPQDGSVLGTGRGASTNGFVNGSIGIDEFSNHVLIKFKTPRDYDDQSGLMQLESEQTFIQGIYTAIRSINRFENGKFTTTLKLARVLNQNLDSSSNTGSLSNSVVDSNRPDLPPGQFANPNPVSQNNSSVTVTTQQQNNQG